MNTLAGRPARDGETMARLRGPLHRLRDPSGVAACLFIVALVHAGHATAQPNDSAGAAATEEQAAEDHAATVATRAAASDCEGCHADDRRRGPDVPKRRGDLGLHRPRGSREVRARPGSGMRRVPSAYGIVSARSSAATNAVSVPTADGTDLQSLPLCPFHADAG